MVDLDQDQVRVWAARLAAPVGFFLAATVLILLVQSGLSNGSESAATTPTTVPTTTGSDGNSPTTTGRQPARKKFYKVRSGDTLESIANRFDTTVDRLLELNPDIDPLALSTGQKVRVT